MQVQEACSALMLIRLYGQGIVVHCLSFAPCFCSMQVDAHGKVVNVIELPSSLIKQLLRDRSPLLSPWRREQCSIRAAFVQPKVWARTCAHCRPQQCLALFCLKKGDVRCLEHSYKGWCVAGREHAVLAQICFKQLALGKTALGQEWSTKLVYAWLSLPCCLSSETTSLQANVCSSPTNVQTVARTFCTSSLSPLSCLQVPADLPYRPPGTTQTPELLSPPPSCYSLSCQFWSPEAAEPKPVIPPEVPEVLAFVLHESGAWIGGMDTKGLPKGWGDHERAALRRWCPRCRGVSVIVWKFPWTGIL